MTQAPLNWLADEHGDLRPEAAQALHGLGAQAAGAPPGSPPRIPPRRRVQQPVQPLPTWLPRAILAFVVVLGFVLGVTIAAVKMKHPVHVPVEVTQRFLTTVAVPNAKLRADRSTHSEILLTLQPNQEVEVVGMWNGWVRVHVAGKDGWIYGGLLRSVGSDVLGPATLLKPMVVKTYNGRIALYLGQKLLVEGHSAPGYVVAVLPNGRRVSVPSAYLLFTPGGS